MRRQGLVLAATLYFGAISAAGAQESKVCFSGVCLGASMAEIPANIKWEPVNVWPKNARFRGPEYDILMASYLRADPPVLNQLKQYRDMMGNIAGLNAAVIGALQKVRGSCVRFTLEGSFYSDSHHLTAVTVKPYPSADGKTQTFRVSQIIRHYDDVVTQDQKSALQSTLEDQFGVRFGAARLLYDVPNAQNRTPNVDFGLGSPTTVFIGESVATRIGTENPYIYRALPGCTTQVKVD